MVPSARFVMKHPAASCLVNQTIFNWGGVYRLEIRVIDTAGVTKSHTLVIDTAHAERHKSVNDSI